MSSRIFGNVIAISVVAIIKTKSSTIAFFFSFPLFLPLALSFLLPFSFVIMILELLGLKKHAL